MMFKVDEKNQLKPPFLLFYSQVEVIIAEIHRGQNVQVNFIFVKQSGLLCRWSL